MAPNVAVRSESWLNLSVDMRNQQPQVRKCERASTCEPIAAAAVAKVRTHSKLYEKSFSLDESTTPTAAAASTAHNDMKSVQNTNARARYSYTPVVRSTGSELRRVASYASDTRQALHVGGELSYALNQQQHLLIRLRQQSYKLNRSSSNASSTSNLSNSIDLTPSAIFVQKENPFEDHRTQTKTSVRLHESSTSHRLRLFREKLSRRTMRRVEPKRNSTIVDLTTPSSPIVRSLSSFSERVSDKFSHFRHSCKHFLHNVAHHQKSNTASSQTIEAVERQTQTDKENNCDDNDNNNNNNKTRLVVDKRQLTDHWIMRHHSSAHFHDDRPKSLDFAHQAANNERQQQQQQRQHSELLVQLSEQEKKQPIDRTFVNSSSHSSITLVSEQQSTPRIEAEDEAEEENVRLALSFECRSSLDSSLNSSSSLQATRKQARNELKTKTTANKKREENEGQVKSELENNNSIKQQAEQLEDNSNCQLQLPTSDYWSTVTTNSDHYNCWPKSGHQMAAPSRQQQQQQLIHHQPQAVMLLNCNQADQEYYFDVANAAAIERQLLLQQQQQQQLIELANASAHAPPAPDISQLTHTNLSSAFAAAASGQPAIVDGEFLSQPELQLQVQVDEDYCDQDYAVPSDETCRLDRSQVELVQMIGEGQKGFVFLGKLQSKDGQHIQDVAIKTLKYETDELIEKLMREAAMMRQFEHPHIIKFIGVCPETPALIAMELAQFGEMKHYLKLNKHLTSSSQLVLFTFQISTALSYLESKQFVHRDVAARNVLVCAHNCVKLADFGLSRNLLHQTTTSEHQQQQQHGLLMTNNNSQQDYVALSRGKLPVRWLAPESLAFRRFTSASDVWMFAVCSWELFHFAQLRPWAHIRNNQVLLAIESGQRLARPPNCPARLYQLMLQCWSYAPIQRPKFKELKQILWSIYLNERAHEQLELEQQQQQQQQQLIASRHHQQQQQQQRHLARNKQDKMNMLLLSEQHQTQMRLALQPQDGATVNARFSASPSSGGLVSNNNTNYIANSAGYSSTTQTVESSPSSSLGSLARRKAQQQQQQQHQEQLLCAHTNAHNNHQLMTTVASAHDDKLKDNDDDEDELDKANKQLRLQQCQMRRFQRTKGHVLQKQRSHGSIVNNREQQQQQQQQHHFQFNQNLTRGHAHRHVGYDDHALFHAHFQQTGATGRQQYYVPTAGVGKQATVGSGRPLSEFRIIREQVDTDLDADADIDDDDDEDDEDDDDSASNEPACQRTAISSRSSGTQSRLSTNSATNLLRVSSSAANVVEPAYEGVASSRDTSLNEEISMLNPSTSPAAVVCQQQQQQQPLVGSSGAATPTRSRRRAAGKEPACELEEEKERLADILKSLKMSPMKAKLSYSRQNSLHQHHQQQLAASSSSPDGATDKQKNQLQAQKEQQEAAQCRQLALHKRLLGHIRLQPNRSSAAGAASGKQQESKQSSASEVSGRKKVDCVDQSLQILESLIADNGGHQMAPHWAEKNKQSNSLSNQQQQQPSKLSQLAHDLSSKRLVLELQNYHLNKQKQQKQQKRAASVQRR